MSVFGDFDRLRVHAEQALDLARKVAADRDAGVNIKHMVLGMLVTGVADLARELQPEGAAEKILRDLGRKPGQR